MSEHLPCGLLRIADDGRVLACNAAARELIGAGRESGPARIQEWLEPASRLYFEVSFLPNLRLAGRVEEVYLNLQSGAGAAVPVLVNARREPAAGASDWAMLRIAQRARWEDEVVQARREAERARAELERALAELKKTNWLLRKVAEVLPTCMYCKRVKAGEAEWQSALEYLKKNEIFLSHGCCPACSDRLLADLRISRAELPPDE